MSIQSEIDRIITAVEAAHEKVAEKGGKTTRPYLVGNLEAAIDTIPSASEPELQEKTVTPTTSSQSVTPDSGYDGLSKVTVNAMPTAEQATPSITVSSAGLITASATQSAGYVTSGTKQATKQLTTQAAKTITPSTSNQTAVASGRYTTGAVTVAPIPSTYIQPTGTLDVTENGTHDVKNYESVNVNVATSGGSGGGSVETCTMTIKSDRPVTAYFTLYRDGRITKDYFPVFANTAQTVNDVIKNSLMFVTIVGIYNRELDDYTGDGFYCIDTGTNWAVFTVWDYASTDDCYCELSWL